MNKLQAALYRLANPPKSPRLDLSAAETILGKVRAAGVKPSAEVFVPVSITAAVLGTEVTVVEEARAAMMSAGESAAALRDRAELTVERMRSRIADLEAEIQMVREQGDRKSADYRDRAAGADGRVSELETLLGFFAPADNGS